MGSVSWSAHTGLCSGGGHGFRVAAPACCAIAAAAPAMAILTKMLSARRMVASSSSACAADRGFFFRFVRSMSGDGFREEHDTFGPIQVPNDRYWGAQTQRSVQNFEIGGCDRADAETTHRSIWRPQEVCCHCSGTQTNMNANEAMHIAAVVEAKTRLLPHLYGLHEALIQKQNEFKDIVKIGRTHTQDAVPITLGQVFSAYCTQVRYGVNRVENTLPRLYQLAQGGPAVGSYEEDGVLALC